MFTGHYTSAFVAKAAAPRVPLWALLVAAQFVDIVWDIFVFAGLEHVRLDPALPSNPLDLYHMPYTHSLVATFVWSALALLVVRGGFGYELRAASIVAATVASHWFLDLVVHRPDLPLYGGGPKLGLAIWDYPFAAYTLEVVVLSLSIALYMRAQRLDPPRRRRWMNFAIALLVLQTATSFGPLPTSIAGIVGPALAIYLLIPWFGARLERTAAS